MTVRIRRLAWSVAVAIGIGAGATAAQAAGPLMGAPQAGAPESGVMLVQEFIIKREDEEERRVRRSPDVSPIPEMRNPQPREHQRGPGEQGGPGDQRWVERDNRRFEEISPIPRGETPRERERYRERDHRWRDRGPHFSIEIGPGPDYYQRDRYYDRYDRYERPRYSRTRAHIRWCSERYRSYRVRDNTYQPTRGPRRQCVSPYS